MTLSVCVCVCCCLARALSFCFGGGAHLLSLSLCFVLMMEWYDHYLFVFVMDGFVCVVTWRPCSLFLFWWWGTFSSFFNDDDGIIWSFSFLSWWWTALRVFLLAGRALYLFVLVVGHDLPLSLTLSLTLCFDDKMKCSSVCVLVKNSFFVFGHSVLFWWCTALLFARRPRGSSPHRVCLFVLVMYGFMCLALRPWGWAPHWVWWFCSL